MGAARVIANVHKPESDGELMHVDKTRQPEAKAATIARKTARKAKGAR
jgi:hypothetical protein